MASISTLPAELVVFVVENLDRPADLAALSRINRKFHNAVNPFLYRLAARGSDPWPLAWAAHFGQLGTLVKLLAAGVQPDAAFSSAQTRDAWNKNNAAAGKRSGHDDEDIHLWGSDHGSESEQEVEWSPETTNSDRAGTSTVNTTQPSSDSDQWNQFVETYEDSRSEYSDEDMLDAFDGPDDVSVVSDPDADGLDFAGPMDAPSHTVSRRFTALHLAARRGHNHIVQALLDHGASVNARSENFCDCGRMYGLLNAAECPEAETGPPSWSPLHVAICNSQSETAKLLLARGASHMMDVSGDFSEPYPVGSSATALHQAAATGLVDIVRYLVETGIQPAVDIQDSKTLTPLYYAYAKRRWDSTLPLLMEMGANINVDTKMFLPYSTITPLGEACRMGHFAEADRLMELGADVTRGYIATGSGRGLSPLHMCCMPSARPVGTAVEARIYEEEDRGASRIRTITNLLARGAHIDAKDCTGDTPLIAAAQNLIVSGLTALLRAGADVHARNSVGRTALMQAILGPPNPIGTTPHHFDNALAQILRELLRHGARIDDTDTDGNNALHLVLQFTSSQLAPGFQQNALRILLDKAGSMLLPQARNKNNQTPLHLAFMSRDVDSCDILIRRGFASQLPGALSGAELLEMFQFAMADKDQARQRRLMDLVLDLDAHNQLTSDATLFTRLLSEPGCPALLAASVMSSRGSLPPLDAYDYTTLLCQAIQARDYFLAYRLVEDGADVNGTNEDNCSPLWLLLAGGDMDVSAISTEQAHIVGQFLQALLDRGARVHRPGFNGVRPLSEAIRCGWEHVVAMMLKKNPLRDDPIASSDARYLHAAVAMALVPFHSVASGKIVDLLVGSGASLTELNSDGDTPLSLLLRGLCQERSLLHLNWNYYRFIRVLFGPGVDINRKNNGGRSIAGYLEELLRLKGEGQYPTDLLAKNIQVVGAEGAKEIRFVPRTQKRARRISAALAR